MTAAEQLEFPRFDCGVTREQACTMCHLSTECTRCCVKCMREGRNGTCNGQSCSIPCRDDDGVRWDAWMHFACTTRRDLIKFLPDKYKRAIRKLIKTNDE